MKHFVEYNLCLLVSAVAAHPLLEFAFLSLPLKVSLHFLFQMMEVRESLPPIQVRSLFQQVYLGSLLPNDHCRNLRSTEVLEAMVDIH